ncbi:MAG TPA: hypothetical protein IAA13_03295 [Candidatus Alistipes merdigallinarum]|nr:hypothetical protein [Candidatus Alistipes merdigallinarum]
MSPGKYKYRYDRRSHRITFIAVTIVALLLVGAGFVLGGAYLPAWGLFFLLCIILLYILSIPLYVLLDESVVEVHCIVDMTRIHIEDIEKIRVFGKNEFKRLWPLVGSYGFWGYYGYYFDFTEWTMYKVYASDRKHLVLIEDIYEDLFIVSCDDPETFIKHVLEFRDRKRSEILHHTAQQTEQMDRSETNP